MTTTPPTTRPARRPAPRGFTLVELLMVIAVTLILAGVLLTAVFGAIRGAKRSNIASQLATIGQGLDAFRNDFDTYPALLTHLDANNNNAVLTPELVGSTRQDTLNAAYQAQFHSEWSLPAYLLGAGDLDGDREASTEDDDGADGFGLRSPGPSRAWKNPDGEHDPTRTGRVYGPYLDPGSMDKYVERVVVEPGDDGLIDPVENQSALAADAQALFRIVDVYGVPIRYYRNWPDQHPADAGGVAGDPSAFYAPLCMRSFESVEAQLDGELGDPMRSEGVVTDRYLTTAPYMLLSAGEELENWTGINESDEPVFVPAYGDRLVRDDGDIREVRASQGVISDPGVLTGDLRKQLLKMLETNVRYAP